jgi:acetyltransferase
MGTRSLELFFQPKSIAVIGASDKPNSLGGAVVKNLLSCEFPGTIIPINTRGYEQVCGIPALTRISQLDDPPDLAIICTPPETLPKVIKQLHTKGIGAALLLSTGLERSRSWQYRPDTDRLNQIIDQTRIRVLGPDCLGLVVPWRKLNASLLHVPVKTGNIAYLGQSGTLASGVLDWAYSRNVGFSHVLTLGRHRDVTLPDLIDYVTQEPHVQTLLVQLEDIISGKALIRSLRAASRHKLVLAVKSYRYQENPLNNIPLPRGLLSRDALIDEMLARAGVLRVTATDEMFDCVDALRRQRADFGPRLALLANGRGAAVMAMDRLIQDGGTLATLTEASRTHLRGLLPDYVKTDNPLLVSPDVQPQQLASVANTLLADPQVDALLVIYIPGLGADPLAAASTLAKVARQSSKAVLTSWVGEYSVEASRDLFDENGIPTFDTPDNAIQSYMYMVKHQVTQELLRQTPESLEIPISSAYVDVDKEILEIHRPGDYLLPNYAWKLLKAYGFAFAENRYRTTLDDLLDVAPEVPEPWVLRVHHRDYLYPFAYGSNPRERIRSVARDIRIVDELVPAAERLEQVISERFPSSPVLGYTVQTMHRALDNLQFSFGIGRDAEIGPYLFFGGGGTTADTLVDRQVALPPLNANLAERLIRRSHFFQVLQERSENLERELVTLERWLVALSHIAMNHPWLSGLEVNAIRQRVGRYIAIGIAGEVGHPVTSAIMPYPKELESTFHGRSGTAFDLRPIRGEDEPLLEAFYRELSAESLRLRFFGARNHFNHAELARFAQIDYDREMAFVALDEGGVLKGVVRGWLDADGVSAEYSVIIDDACKGEGLGRHLMEYLLEYLKDRGVLQVVGTVLSQNKPMLTLNRKLGFSLHHNHEEGVVEVVKNLNPLRHAWQRKRMFHQT